MPWKNYAKKTQVRKILLTLFGGNLRQPELVEEDAILRFGGLAAWFAGGNGGRRHGVVQKRSVVVQKQIVAQGVQLRLQFVLMERRDKMLSAWKKNGQ